MPTRRNKKDTNLTFGLAAGEEALFSNLAKSMVHVRVGDDEGPPTLAKSILNVLNQPGQTVERLAFENDPTLKNNFSGVYRPKLRLIPDSILKRISIQDSLVSNIVRARQNHVSSFGRPRPDRFSTGYIIQPNTGLLDKMSEEEKKDFNAEVEKAVKLLWTCGSTEGVSPEDLYTFSEYLAMEARNAVVVGRIATEFVRVEDPGNPGKKRFHRFVPVDAGTIYRATNDKTGQESIRDEAYHLLCQITGKKDLNRENWNAENKYEWVQVVDGRPVQVFTGAEMKVYNFYSVPDIELDGYPVTPLDTVISAVTTHINIVTHNKMYFQSGRASRGMLIISSDDATPTTISNIKQQFNASINSVNNAWRMPVLGCGSEESIQWTPIDSGGGRDMEFQYLTDMNAREILTAFMMSPDELPGWSYLSRGTNNQALSEGNNEYKMTAARDVGIRPLLMMFEDFINSHIFPELAPELAKKAKVKLVGLDTDNAEKEAVRTQQDMGLWMNFDDIMERVEKRAIGKRWGGTIPLNPQFHQLVLDKYLTVGEIREKFMGVEGASKDPRWDYVNNPLWFQQQSMIQQAQQAEQLAQQQAPGGGQPPPGGDGGGAPPQGGQDPNAPKGGNAYGAQTENQKTEASQDTSASGGAAPGAGAQDLARSVDEAFTFMGKAESDLPSDKRKLLTMHRKTLEHFERGFTEDAQKALDEILDIAAHHAPRK